MYNIIRQADRGKVSTKEVSAATYFAGIQGTKVALDAIQLMGGNGYINDNPVGRFLRDAKLYEIGGGTTEIRAWLTGREINKEFLD